MRKGTRGLLAICCLLLAACSDKTSVPFGILSVDKMAPIVWDMVEADQYAAMLIRDSAHADPKMERLRLYELVFRSHDISREKFEKSYNYYKEHPEINQILYDSLTAQGTRYRTEAYAHPFARPVVTPGAPAPGIPPAGTLPARPPNAGPMFHPPGRPGIPILRPFIKPDTSHRKTRPHPTPAEQKKPGDLPSSKHS
ncbi:MAG TPA: DUF4296 domain-containing protein [Puia sp.]|nr:DUF4296 domain-containing protein [Puia sp.]